MLHRLRGLGLSVRVFMPYLGFPPYVQKCEEVAARGYEGFAVTAAGGV